MRDHHVDRPEVEGAQSPQLTGTNRSTAPDPGEDAARVQRQDPHAAATPAQLSDAGAAPATGGLHGLAAIARGQTPDPIPNSAVKTLSADGTAPQGAAE